MNYSKVGTIEGIFLICIGILNHSILYLPQSIFNICGTASILNIIYLSVIVLAFLCLFMKWYKYFRGQDIIDISKYLGGNILKNISGILFIIFYFIITSIMLRNFTEGIHTSYFHYIDLKIILFILLSIVFIANKFGKSSIIKCNTLITFLMIISLIILAVSVIPNIDISKMFPLLGNGIEATFIEGIGNLYAFSGICIIFFIAPMLRDPNSLNKITIISYSILSSILFLVIFILLLGLNFLLYVNELSPMYLLVRSIQFGKFFQNPESLFILIWILSIISFLCVFSMIIILIVQKLLNLKDSTALSGIVTNLIFIFALLPKNFSEIIFVSSKLYRTFQVCIVFIYSFSILGLAYLKRKHQDLNHLKEIKNE